MKEVLTVAIGILILLLLFSILVSGVVNLITSMMNMQAKRLDLALRNMLASSDVHETVYQAFKNHSLYRLQIEKPNRKNSLPSELKPEDFTIILMDVVCQGNPANSPDEMMNYIQQLPDPDLKVVLRSLLRDANNDLNLFKTNIMRWYQTVLERADDWQDQSIRRFSLALALLVAIAFNIDVIQIFKRLQLNPQHLQEMITLAEKVQREGAANLSSPGGATGSYGFPPPGAGAVPPTSSSPSDGGAAESHGFPPPTPGASPSAGSYPPPAAVSGNMVYPSTTEEMQKAINEEMVRTKSPFGLGWDEIDIQNMTIRDWVLKFIGWMVSALGIGLGAPGLIKMGKKIGQILSQRNTAVAYVAGK